MRFASLGSGSRGNATLVQSGSTTIMVDCGFSISETEARLARLGVVPGDIAALLVTHEHSDHASGVARFAARHGITVRCTAGTRTACLKLGFESAEPFDSHARFAIGDLEVTPVTVPHDAREPVQFLFDGGPHRFGLLTDVGSVTPHMRRMFSGCAGLLLECNHDREMLEDGPYPPSLKERVGGPLGHLGNSQAADLLRSLDKQWLQHLAAAHLSEKNNTPALARTALAEAADCDEKWIGVADQETGLDWREIS
ncbi:MAG TPA: MBL fold metallo-hydrolase [Gammaproteobacteria bacterium]|nr:MBL fold metallo-hydrolase [Gammaproteobacteria bacterium]